MKENSHKTSWKGYYGNSSVTNLGTFSTQAQQDQYVEKDIEKKISEITWLIFDRLEGDCVWRGWGQACVFEGSCARQTPRRKTDIYKSKTETDTAALIFWKGKRIIKKSEAKGGWVVVKQVVH